MSVMMSIFAVLLVSLGLNLILWRWEKRGAKTKEKYSKTEMKNATSEKEKSGESGQMDEWYPHMESVTSGNQKDTQFGVDEPKFIKSKIMYTGTYRHLRSKAQIWAFARLYTSGRLVAPYKYRWVVRIQFSWNSDDPSSKQKLQTVHTQIKPDIIANPLEARCWVERYLERKGYKKHFPVYVYPNDTPTSESCRALVAKLGLEPIDNWPQARDLDELLAGAD